VPEAEVIPPGVDLARSSRRRRRPGAAADRHAPSSRRRKGTEHVVAAVDGLDADLELVEGSTTTRRSSAIARQTSSSTS
jgi:hypothetical protein